MRSATLHRHGNLTTLSVEAYEDPSDGGQGAPSYGSAVEVEAHTRESTELVVDSDGSEVVATLTAWVPSTASYKPVEHDRVTEDGTSYVVVTAKRVENLRGDLDHVKLTLRDA